MFPQAHKLIMSISIGKLDRFLMSIAFVFL